MHTIGLNHGVQGKKNCNIKKCKDEASVSQVRICSDDGLSPIRRQAIIWTNAGLLSIGPLGTNFSEILTKIQNFSFKKMQTKISSAKWRAFCPGGDELAMRKAQPNRVHTICDTVNMTCGDGYAFPKYTFKL